MQTRRIWKTTILRAFLALTTFLSACQKADTHRSQSTHGQTVTAGEGGGGVDGSGGNTHKSSKSEVQTAFDEVLKDLPGRLNQIYKNLRLVDKLYDDQYGGGAHELMNDFISAVQDRVHTGPQPYGVNLQNGQIKIKLQNSVCRGAHEQTAGRAVGDIDHGAICISLERLKNVPPNVLHEEIFALLVHELSHLRGFSEEKAVRLQKLVASHPGVYLPGNRDPLPKGFKPCDSDLIYAEVKSMQQSKYWQSQKMILESLLSGVQERGCPDLSKEETPIEEKQELKANIFVDDVEFLRSTTKFVNPRWPIETVDRGEPRCAIASVSEIQNLTAVATIRLEVSGLVIDNIIPKLGTDAQCSPKILLANLIANAPDALNAGCGWNREINEPERIRARIQREKDILAGDEGGRP